jgi:acetylglutamate kinase
MGRRGIAPSFVDGRRVTTAEVLEVVRASLAAVNGEVCAEIGPKALALFGDEIGLVATQLESLGLVGEPTPSAPPAIVQALAAGRIPVVAPLGARAGDGASLNVNADEAAAALAVGLGADRILFVSDVPGVLLGEAVVERIAADDADRMLGDGTFEGGIVPKLEAAVIARRGGVQALIGVTEVVA